MSKIIIYGISGSNRSGSYNTAILEFIEKNIKDDVDFKILNISNLPIFNEDLEENLPKEVIEFKKHLNEAKGFIIATPEYNYSISALLKNALDWGSRGKEKYFDNKNVAIISALPSLLGGARAQYQLRQICVSLNLIPINKPEIFVSKANEKIFDNDIKDEKTRELIIKLVDELILKIKKGEFYE